MITDLKPYSMYKDSGIEWLGPVPIGWEVQRLRHSVKSVVGGVWGEEPNGIDDLVCVRVADFDRRNSRVRLSTPTIRAVTLQERSRRLLRPGDLLLEKSGGGEQRPVGFVVLYDHEAPAVCSNFVARLRPAKFHEPTYLVYLHSVLYRCGLSVPAIKQTTGIQNLDIHAYLGQMAPFPPRTEQAAIVRFLDHVDSRIQRFIKVKERLIELLEEEKQGIIHRVVTRGLDSDVPLKPSGVDWLGDVPVHWEVRRLKSLASVITSGSRGWSEYAADEGPRFVRITNLSRDSIQLDWRDTIFLDLPEGIRNGEGKRTRVRADDLLLSITAYIGSVAVAPNDIEEAYISQHVALCRLRDTINPRWVAYVLLSPVGQIYGRLTMYGGTKQGLSLEDVGNYLVLLPPRDEQNRIVGWIDRETVSVERGIEKARRAITLLREYRTRLAADVVTGKLDVREAAERLPDDPGTADPALDEQLEEVIA